MNKIVEEFLGEVKEQKIKQLLGISLDKKYFASVLGEDDVDIEQLRTELAEEQGRVIKTKTGKVHQDNRDMDKISALNVKINTIEKATQELTRLEEMEKGIKAYMVFVDNPSEEALKELEEVAGL